MEVDFIVSGGEDGTTRIWGYDEIYQSYDLIALVQHSQSDLADAVSNNLEGNMFSPLPEDASSRVGVTAVACSGSRSSISAGEFVKVDVDEDYIRAELDYIDDMDWMDEMTVILGARLRVLSVNLQKETVVLKVDQALTQSTEWQGRFTEVELPTLVVERDRKFTVRDGPFISGTSWGDVSILCLMCEEQEDGIQIFRGVHQGAVNDISVIPTGNDSLEFVVITAGEDAVAAMLTVLCTEVRDSNDVVSLKLLSAEVRKGSDGSELRLKHNRGGEPLPVLQVRALGVDLGTHDRVSFASLTRGGVHLWSADGADLMVLTIRETSLMWDATHWQYKQQSTKVLEYKGLAAVSKDTGSLLFVSGDGFVGVWFVDDGMVTGANTMDQAERLNQWEKELIRYKQSNVGIKPMAVYEQNGTMLDVDQAGSTAVFAVDLRQDLTCSLWKLESVSPDFLAVDPSTLANSLIMPGRETILLELLHSSKVCHLRAANDPDEGGAGGAAIITGCEDGNIIAWDVAGIDKGQKYAEMRSLSPFEYLLPPFMLLVSAVQYLSFAFGPSIPWREEIKSPVSYVRTVAFFDFKYHLHIKMEAIFWPKTYAATAIMVAFICYSLVGGHSSTEAVFRYVQNSARYKAERQQCFRPAHYALACLKPLANLAFLGIYLVSTVGMVPLAKTIAGAVDCVPRHEDDSRVCWWGGCKLATAPTVECYTGEHWSLVWKLVLIFPAFLFTAAPIAACAGDATYVPFNTLVDWKVMWREAARRRATDLHLGYLHPRPDAAFSMNMMELASRVLLPFITFLTTRYPVFQMAAVSTLGAASLMHALWTKPYLEQKYFYFVVWLKVYTWLVMLIGLLSAILDDQESRMPTILLACVTLLVFIFGSWNVWFTELRPTITKVYTPV
eukprot:TRINITY_DN29488_c0_g1_i1.p1 TRINITY_DN29488_c0_g1~~TRINITY_DN29488_c0_g1_i1.p1  ORF type:complete len:977 (+),score=150.44 TRINITY_DN29488_c0_g1_i1:241-2931(+)